METLVTMYIFDATFRQCTYARHIRLFLKLNRNKEKCWASRSDPSLVIERPLKLVIKHWNFSNHLESSKAKWTHDVSIVNWMFCKQQLVAAWFITNWRDKASAPAYKVSISSFHLHCQDCFISRLLYRHFLKKSLRNLTPLRNCFPLVRCITRE